MVCLSVGYARRRREGASQDEAVRRGAVHLPRGRRAGDGRLGIVCVGGIDCSSGREFGDFQTVTIDNAGRANVVYDRVTGTDSQVMFVRQS